MKGAQMPRQPNYRWQRNERTRVKQAKKAERLKAKQARADEKRVEASDSDAAAEAETAVAEE
jgi:hypothetical protein